MSTDDKIILGLAFCAIILAVLTMLHVGGLI